MGGFVYPRRRLLCLSLAMTYLASNKPITLPELGRMKLENQKIAMLTGYDASFAAL
mgnify:CR=1 FL=1